MVDLRKVQLELGVSNNIIFILNLICSIFIKEIEDLSHEDKRNGTLSEAIRLSVARGVQKTILTVT